MSKRSTSFPEVQVFVNGINLVAHQIEQQVPQLPLLLDSEVRARYGDQVETMTTPLRRLRDAVDKALAALKQEAEPACAPPRRGSAVLRQ